MNDLCKQAVETGKLTLTSNVLQQRDFIPMNDVCSVVERFIFHKNFEEKNNSFNVGSGSSSSLLDITKIVQSR